MSLLATKSDDGKFQPFQPRKKKRIRKGAASIKLQSFAARMKRAEEEIRDTQWVQDCQKKVEASFETLCWDPDEVLVLCLGLGSPMVSKSAAAQLVFISSICQTLNIPSNRVEFFDPHFVQEDIQGLLAKGFNVLTDNKHGKYTVKSRTMLFMPHCGVELYENILQQNWNTKGLQRILLIGNVLQEYETGTPGWRFKKQTPCLSRICKYLSCDIISPFEAFPLAFNNLGLQYINTTSLPSHDDRMWHLPSPAADEKPSAEIT